MSYLYKPTTHEKLNGGANAGAWSAWGSEMSARLNTTFEPQRLNNFEFIVLKEAFSDMVFPGSDKDDGLNLTISQEKAQEVLRLAVVSAFIPHYKQGVITMNRGNNQLKYAGAAEFDSGTLVINDFIGSDAKVLLMTWQNLSYNPKTEKVGLASDYKKTCKLIEYTPDYQPVREWTLYGCWISELSESNPDYEGGRDSVQKVTATIQYDKAVIGDDFPALNRDQGIFE